MRFQEALSKKALEEHGTLGNLILKGKLEEPKEMSKQITTWLMNMER
jgi:hypothetical protein